MDMVLDLIGFSYAVLVSAGGIIGYVKAGKSYTLTFTF